MRVTLDALEVSITVQELAVQCRDANREFYKLLPEAHKMADGLATDLMSIEKAIQYAYVAGVENGAKNHTGIRISR